MKHLIPLVLALLLWGCAAQQPGQSPTAAVTGPEPAALLTPSTADAPLLTYGSEEILQGLSCLNDSLLVFTGTEETTLSLVDPGTMAVTAAHTPGFLLLPENSTFQPLDAGLSYFTGSHTVVLDETLQEVRRISAPEGLQGFPLLSSDGRSLYYCTADAIRVLDLESGISRILKEAAYPVQGLSGILMEDRVLQLSLTDTDGSWWTLFLSAENGQLLRQCPENVLPQTHGQDYFYRSLTSAHPAILFGTGDSVPHALSPRGQDPDSFWLPQNRQVLTAWFQDGGVCLDLYGLTTGQRTAAVSTAGFPRCVTEVGNDLFFLCFEDNTLYRWDPSGSPVTDTGNYIIPYHTRQEPDYDGLALCTLRAEELSEKHGINILVYKDAVKTQPWDYTLEYEYQPEILQAELDSLDRRLSRFPAGFLKTIADKFTSLSICLVRSARGTPESGSLEAVDGIQFLVDFDAYVVLSTAHDTEYALYHELSHLMETVVLTQSTAYDRWNTLNPEDFDYDNDYIRNQKRDGSQWLKPGSAYFIDTYAMSYPREDRARLFEYAMTAGHEALFSSPNLQQKLRQLCIGLREAFLLEDASFPLPWEQYLTEPVK